MLDVRRLTVLAAAVRERSIAAAARSLDITPSAASQAIGALEAQTGTQLLVRVARGVVPTSAGERLATQAEAVLAQLATAELELAGGDRGVLRVAAFATAVAGLLPQTLARMRGVEPQLRMHVLEAEPDTARAALAAGVVDVALVNHHALLAPDAAGPWRVMHVLDEPVLAALPPGHRLAHAMAPSILVPDEVWTQEPSAAVDIRDLAADDWVMQAAASPCQEMVVRACADAGFAPSVSATCADYYSILRLVQAGHGVALIPRLALGGDRLPEKVTVLPLRIPVTRRVNALIPPGRADNPAIRALLSGVRDAAAA